MTAAQVLAQRYGIATNMLCGPSESLLLADDTADPVRLALDLVNEAEHGADSAALVATDAPSLVATRSRRSRRAGRRPAGAAPHVRHCRRSATSAGCSSSTRWRTRSPSPNDYAAEHMQVATVDPETTLRDLRYAGEILLGQDTPIGASSYSIGIPATLPTGGFAKVNGGVTAAHVPDDDVDRSAHARGACGARRPDHRAGRPRGLPGPRERLPRARLGRPERRATRNDGDPCRRRRAVPSTSSTAPPRVGAGLDVEHEPERLVETLDRVRREPPDGCRPGSPPAP